VSCIILIARLIGGNYPVGLPSETPAMKYALYSNS